MRHRRKYIAVGAIGLAIVLYLLHPQLLIGIAKFMAIRDPLDKADFILPLYHEGQTVLFAAADLHRHGYASRLVLGHSRPSRLEALGLVSPAHEVWRGVLEAEGVPPEAITMFGSQIDNEVEMGRALGTYLLGRGNSRIIIVASAPASRLSKNDLLRGLDNFPVEVRMYPVQLREFNEQPWWRSRHGWVSYFDVYFLWLLRWLRD